MKILWPFIKKFRHQWLMMLIGISLSFITLLAGIGLLSLSGWFLSASAVAGLSIVTAQAFNFFTPAGGVRFLSIIRTASRYAERLATHEATFNILTDLRVWVWQKLMPLSPKNLQSIRQGDMLNRLVADVDTLDHIYLRLITPLTASLLMIASLYIFIAWFDLRLAKILCGILLLSWFLLPLVFYVLGNKPGKKLIEAKQSYRVQLLEYIQGQAELVLFGADKYYRAKLLNSENTLLDSQKKMNTITALSQSALITVSGVALISMLYFAAENVGQVSPPGALYALMVFAAMACLEMLMPLAGSFQHLSSCILAAKRLNQITEQTPDIIYPKQSSNKVIAGQICIDSLSFQYEDKMPFVLNNFSLHIKAGSKVAILGKTGCGKSTLLSLITRQWQAPSGKILIDDRAIEQFTEAQLRDDISLLAQRVYIFSASLRDNLLLAVPESRKVTDKQLIEVLEKVGLSQLTQQKNVLDLWLGEGGRQLSGGEQRRIGIARVLLRDAPILLLDEPTEGLDKGTEREILQLLIKFAHNKTLLMITHRLTAMAQMDEIHLMENGQIISSGNHQYLRQHSSAYQYLNRQLN